MTLSRAEKLRRCQGCRANRYNMGTVDECWHFKSARAANKKVYYSPGDYEPSLRKKVLTCWHNRMGWGMLGR